MGSFIYNAFVIYVLVCTAFNICWWLYGKTLSEAFPLPIVVTTMLTTLLCFFVAFLLLMREVCYNIFTSEWGYTTNYGLFVPFAEEIARVLSAVLAIGMAVLIYKDEGKMADSKYEDVLEEEKQNIKRQDEIKSNPVITRKDLGKIE